MLHPLAPGAWPDLPPGALDPGGALGDTPLWWETTLAEAAPPGAACWAAAGPVTVLLRAEGRRLSALTTPYTLTWRPLIAPGAGEAAIVSAGRALAGCFRWRPPARFEAMPAEAPGLAALAAGLRAGGLAILPFAHFGNRFETLPPGGWEGYLAARPSALRNTIRRRLARAARDFALQRLEEPGTGLEAAIEAFEAVRARSWKPTEPAPGFDAALIRATAAAGLLRLGVLREAATGRPVAAQYWVLEQGRRRAVVPKLFHDEAAKAASPGTVLTAWMIRGLIEQDGVAEIDFGRGDDPYKQGWAAMRRERLGWLIADPRHPAGLAAVARARLRGWWRAARRRAPARSEPPPPSA